MTTTAKKLTALAMCGALLGSTGIANAAPRDHHRPAASHSQKHRSAPIRRHAKPIQRTAPRRSVHKARSYHRGGYVPHAWRVPSRTVRNWHVHRGLYQPPRGYQWVRGNDGDFLLVAIATGVIASIITNTIAY